MNDGYKTVQILKEIFDIECSVDEAIELEQRMWGVQICRTCTGNSVGDYAIRIQELEKQLQQAHRAGWEQAKGEAVGITDKIGFAAHSRTDAQNCCAEIADAIASMDFMQAKEAESGKPDQL